MAGYLLQRSMKPALSSFDGLTVLPWIVLAGEDEQMQALLPRFGRPALSSSYAPFKRTLVHRAVLSLPTTVLGDKLSTLLSLVDQDCVNAVDAFGRTPLHYAAALGKDAAMNILIEVGAADVSVKDKAGNTALHLCSLPDCAEILLRKGANVNDMNLRRQPPLAVASSLGLLELRSCLLAWGARGKYAVNLVPPKKFKIQIKMTETDVYDDGLVIE